MMFGVKMLFSLCILVVGTKGGYPLVNIQNSTPFPVSGTVAYASLFCSNDGYSASAGKSWTASSRGVCLVTGISATMETAPNTHVTCSSYGSSGTSYSQFAVISQQSGSTYTCGVTRRVFLVLATGTSVTPLYNWFLLEASPVHIYPDGECLQDSSGTNSFTFQCVGTNLTVNYYQNTAACDNTATVKTSNTSPLTIDGSYTVPFDCSLSTGGTNMKWTFFDNYGDSETPNCTTTSTPMWGTVGQCLNFTDFSAKLVGCNGNKPAVEFYDSTSCAGSTNATLDALYDTIPIDCPDTCTYTTTTTSTSPAFPAFVTHISVFVGLSVYIILG